MSWIRRRAATSSKALGHPDAMPFAFNDARPGDEESRVPRAELQIPNRNRFHSVRPSMRKAVLLKHLVESSGSMFPGNNAEDYQPAAVEASCSSKAGKS